MVENYAVNVYHFLIMSLFIIAIANAVVFTIAYIVLPIDFSKLTQSPGDEVRILIVYPIILMYMFILFAYITGWSPLILKLHSQYITKWIPDIYHIYRSIVL